MLYKSCEKIIWKYEPHTQIILYTENKKIVNQIHANSIMANFVEGMSPDFKFSLLEVLSIPDAFLLLFTIYIYTLIYCWAGSPVQYLLNSEFGKSMRMLTDRSWFYPFL
jgi:hypothetical protein